MTTPSLRLSALLHRVATPTFCPSAFDTHMIAIAVGRMLDQPSFGRPGTADALALAAEATVFRCTPADLLGVMSALHTKRASAVIEAAPASVHSLRSAIAWRCSAVVTAGAAQPAGARGRQGQHREAPYDDGEGLERMVSFAHSHQLRGGDWLAMDAVVLRIAERPETAAPTLMVAALAIVSCEAPVSKAVTLLLKRLRAHPLTGLQPSQLVTVAYALGRLDPRTHSDAGGIITSIGDRLAAIAADLTAMQLVAALYAMHRTTGGHDALTRAALPQLVDDELFLLDASGMVHLCILLNARRTAALCGAATVARWWGPVIEAALASRDRFKNGEALEVLFSCAMARVEAPPELTSWADAVLRTALERDVQPRQRQRRAGKMVMVAARLGVVAADPSIRAALLLHAEKFGCDVRPLTNIKQTP
jgi:hypothetical protein